MNNNYCLHITHNDGDALGCSLVLKHVYRDWEIKNCFCGIGFSDKILLEELDSIENKISKIPNMIIISDISLSDETCSRLELMKESYGFELLGFDHHKTNTLDKKYPWFKVQKETISKEGNDIEISAAYVMYDYFKEIFPELNFEGIFKTTIEMISNYDTWMWKKYPKLYTDKQVDADIIANMCRTLGISKTFDLLCEKFYDKNEEDLPEIFYILYDIENENIKRYLKSLDNKVRIMKSEGFTYGMFICENNYSNAASDYILNKYNYLDLNVIIFPTSNKVGFRTLRNDINLGDVAKTRFNGGGHPKAAGCWFDDMDFLKVLNHYYEHGIPILEFTDKERENE